MENNSIKTGSFYLLLFGWIALFFIGTVTAVPPIEKVWLLLPLILFYLASRSDSSILRVLSLLGIFLSAMLFILSMWATTSLR
jgi:hypothetical protein